MASFNVSAEDCTPLITYGPVGAWTDTPDGDAATQSYSAQSWHTTSTQGATATITFNGTGIWLYGAMRPNYGEYTVAIDGQATSGNANSDNPLFQQLLGGQSGLPMGSHTAILTNTGSGSFVDIDSIIFQTQIGSSGATVSNSTTDDMDPQITYLPQAEWTINQSPDNIDNTLHFTQTGGAQALYKFTGDAVAVHGTTSPDHANYTVTIDGITRAYDGGSGGNSRLLHPQTLLYFADNLGSGEHNLIVTANPDQAGQQNTGKFMDIDAVTTYTTSAGAGGSNNSGQFGNPAAPAEAGHSGAISTGVVVGAIAGVIAGLLFIILVVFLLFRRRRIRNQSKMPLQSPSSPSLPIQHPDDLEKGFASTLGVNPFADPEVPSFRADAPVLSVPMSFPQTPRRSVARDSFSGSSDSDHSDVQARGDKLSNFPPRPRRPPTLNLPVK